jgi:Tfp pilus assembly protein PilO
MNALFGLGGAVPLARVGREHRRWLMPLAVIVVINIGVLVGLVLPLRQSVQSGGARAQTATAALQAARTEFAAAEATRDGQAEATRDLDRFYREVLPADVSQAQRSLHLKLTQLASAHDVTFARRASNPEVDRLSDLERLRVSYGLSGDWDDIRQFLYAIETGADFVIIDNVVLAEGSDSSTPLSLTLELSTYYRVARDVR